MSIYKIDIQKSIGTEYWTNVYYTNQPDLATAVTTATDIVTLEESIHMNFVTFDKALVTDLSTDFFTTVPINAFGGRTPDSDRLPLWNVVRVDFAVNGRRPGRKYLRIPVLESHQTDGVLTPGEIQWIIDHYCTPLHNAGQICNEHGDAFVDIVVNPNVAMRQLRRGSKRKVTPVI